MKSVAIVGGGPTRKLAPWTDSKWEIWTLNEAASKTGNRSEVVFQMHDPGIYQSTNNITDPKHWEWLQQLHNIKVYMQKKDPLVPDSLEYPFKEIMGMVADTKQRGKNDRELYPVELFTFSGSYALALAILQGYTRIRIYGIELTHTEEYRYQRESFAFWVGFASGRGIELEIYGADSIFKRPLYGYETFKEFRLMKFGISERLHLLGVLPDKGNLVTMKVVSEMKGLLSFTEEEIKEFELQTETPDPSKPDAVIYKWNKEKEVEKEIELGETSRKVILATFEVVDKNNAFTEPLLHLYEKFTYV